MVILAEEAVAIVVVRHVDQPFPAGSREDRAALLERFVIPAVRLREAEWLDSIDDDLAVRIGVRDPDRLSDELLGRHGVLIGEALGVKQGALDLRRYDLDDLDVRFLELFS